MFERFTERARRVIFFARFEASQSGSAWIETEHLLLGLIRENRGLLASFSPSVLNEEAVRARVSAREHAGPKVSTSVDLPLSHKSKRVLAYAAEEAESLGHRHLGSELLHERGPDAEEVRRRARQGKSSPGDRQEQVTELVSSKRTSP